MSTYGLKYFFEIQRDGHAVRLNVYQREYAGGARMIGDFQGMRLDIQGANVGICDPIVKTSLSFTVADTVDKQDTATTKFGGWEEFYTPDATLYKVEVVEDDVTRWTGFVTPDSWNESLQYHGSLTIVARDMIGHLGDFLFDKADLGRTLKGGFLVSIADLVRRAMLKVEMPMEVVTDSIGQMPVSANGGTSCESWLIDVRGLKSGSWLDVLERTLSSCGLVLRYADRNKVVLMSIRSMHLMGSASEDVQEKLNVQILNRSGVRTLAPAYREIQETLRYEKAEDDVSTFPASAFTPKGMYHVFNGTNGWSQPNIESAVVAPRMISATENDAAGFWLLRNSSFPYATGGYVQKEFLVSAGVQARVAFTLKDHGYPTTSLIGQSGVPGGIYKYAILWVTSTGSIYSYTDGAWTMGEVNYIEYNTGSTDWTGKQYITVEQEIITPDAPGNLYLRFMPFNARINYQPIAAGVCDVTVGFVDNVLPKTLSVRTIYDEKQNFSLKRDVTVGEAPTWLDTAGCCVNALYQNGVGYPSVHRCMWPGEEGSLPVPVMNHLQIIAYNAKANSVISGDIRDKDGKYITFDALWLYSGRKFLLQSGSLDLVSGTLTDAMLREFNTYEEVWDGMEISYRLIQGNAAGQPEMVIDENTKGGGGGGEASISVTPGSVSFEAAGGNAEIIVSASGPYGVETPSWITASISGSRVTLTATENGTASRSGSVRFYVDGTDAEALVSVSQAAKQVIEDSIEAYRLNNPFYDYDEITADNDTGNGFDVRSSQAWVASVESGGSWLSLDERFPTSGGPGTDSVWYVTRLNTGAFRQGVILVRQPSTGLEARFYVKQAGGGTASYLYLTPSGTKQIASDTWYQDVEITSNKSWRLTASDGVELSQTSGTGNGSVRMSFSENTGQNERQLSMTATTTTGTSVTDRLILKQAGKGSQPSDYFYTDKSSLTFEKSAGSSSVILSASSSWSASSDSSWCTVQPTSGTAGTSKTINISVTANAGDERTAKVTISGSAGEVVVTVKQKGGDDSISLSSDGDFFNGEGQSKPVTVTSSGSWTSSVSDDWISISPESGVSGQVVAITASENGANTRTGTVTFTRGKAKAVYTVTQLGQSIDTQLEINPASDECGYEATSGTINVAANVDWEITNISAGLSFSKKSGSGAGTATWFVTKNEGSSERVLTAVFAAKNGDKTRTFTLTQLPASIEVSPTSTSVNYIAQNVTAEVTATGSWSAASNKAWAVPQRNGDQLLVRVDENTSTLDRSATITLTCDGTDVSCTFTVNQTKAPAQIRVSPSGAQVDANTTSGSFQVTSNHAWTIVEVSAGLSLNVTRGGSSEREVTTVEWTIPANTTAADVNYTCKVRSTDGSAYAMASVISKTNVAEITVVPDGRVILVSKSSPGTFKVRSTMAFTIAASDSWIKYSPTGGQANTEYEVTCSSRIVATGSMDAVLTIASGTSTKEVAVAYIFSNDE